MNKRQVVQDSQPFFTTVASIISSAACLCIQELLNSIKYSRERKAVVRITLRSEGVLA
jgi:hypothetical protein